MTIADDRVWTRASAWGLGLSVDQEPWMEGALCAQTDPEACFPEKGGSTREAKRMCFGCEVREECLNYALVNDERFGIWGGFSERERRRLRAGETVTPAARVESKIDRRPNGHGIRCTCLECDRTYNRGER